MSETQKRSSAPKMIRSLREIANDERIYLHAKYYQKGAFALPISKDGSVVTFTDCPARYLNNYHNPWAEVDQQIYLCQLSDCVRHMFGEEFSRSSAFCLRNLSMGCCPHGFGNPLPFSGDSP